MLVCATPNKTNFSLPPGNLFLPVPDTGFRDYLDEVDEVLRFAPKIVAAIEQDLDTHARKKKHSRMEDRRFFESHTADLPELDIRQRTIVADELTLAVGRPRMPGDAVYLFLMLRGFLGSLSSKSAQRFLRESMSLHALLQERELKMPGWLEHHSGEREPGEPCHTGVDL